MAKITDRLDSEYRQAQPRERNEESNKMKEEKKLLSNIQEQILLYNFIMCPFAWRLLRTGAEDDAYVQASPDKLIKLARPGGCGHHHLSEPT